MNRKAVRLAAQADLILLTADMLRPPSRNQEVPDWLTLSTDELDSLLQAAYLPKTTSADGTPLAAALRDIFVQARATTATEWSDEYWRLFDSAIACPIHQASYVRRDKGAILGDLAGFYHAFGWRHDLHRGERPDHLLCELEFVAVLLAMAAQAPAPRQRRVADDALRKLAQTHLQDWLPSFCWQLCETTRSPLFGAIGTWLMMLWDALNTSHQWTDEDRDLPRLDPQRDVENPYECAAGGLIQIGDH